MSDDVPEPSEAAQAIAAAVATMAEMLSPVLDATTGLRAKLMNEGWAPVSAEAMAVKTFETQLAYLALLLMKGATKL